MMRWPQAHRYVAPRGSDENRGSRRRPKATVQAGIDALPSRGGIVELEGGTHWIDQVAIPGGVTVRMRLSSWWERWLRL